LATTAPNPRRRAIFLDRDGTIIRDAHFLARPDQIELMPGAVEGLRALSGAGFRLIVVSNQSGIARGYFKVEDLQAVERALDALLRREGVIIDAWYYCPHLDEGCDCRKPRPGMLLRAARDLGVDLGASYMVGDGERDVEAGRAAGVKRAFLLGKDASDLRSIATLIEALSGDQ
jgi:D-glycero-D-manno-heptose 1,7-bisphosphate phosphatase